MGLRSNRAGGLLEFDVWRPDEHDLLTGTKVEPRVVGWLHLRRDWCFDGAPAGFEEMSIVKHLAERHP